jgi:hypothetical protein
VIPLHWGDNVLTMKKVIKKVGKRVKASKKDLPNLDRPKTLLGVTHSPYPLPADIDDPVDVEWDAMK